MQLKPITAIIVLSLLVVSLSIAGCTTSNTNQTPTPSTATHDAFLEKYIAAIKTYHTQIQHDKINAWEVTWINSTSARLERTVTNYNRTINSEDTFIVFPTSQEATNYLNAMNKTAYSLTSTEYSGTPYKDATGHAPKIYKYYEWTEGNILNISEFRIHAIQQLDNMVEITTGKYIRI